MAKGVLKFLDARHFGSKAREALMLEGHYKQMDAIRQNRTDPEQLFIIEAKEKSKFLDWLLYTN